MSQITERKDSHLAICAAEDVEPNDPLFGDVSLVHQAIPDFAVENLDISTKFWGHTLKAPILATGMTGGSSRAAEVNRDIALAAERQGIAFGLGSQRAMVEHPDLDATYQVRSVAPTTLILGNLGVMQAAAMAPKDIRALVDRIGADGIALHLNSAQELFQAEGDRDFRGAYATIAKLVEVFGERIVVKETGCGISPEVARRLAAIGIRSIDVSGLGGTSWVRVEELRGKGLLKDAAGAFAGWGIPTAVALSAISKEALPGIYLIASGGIRDGLSAAKAIALGASLCGMALPLFRAQQLGGAAAVEHAIACIITQLKAAMLLTGSHTLGALRDAPRVVSGRFDRWMAALRTREGAHP